MYKTDHESQVAADFVVGGAFQAYTVASPADIVVVIDSRNELTRLLDLPYLIKVPLGERDTVLSLLERLQEAFPDAQALLEEYRHRQNVHLASGMAQDPRLGMWAIKDLELSGELEKIFNQVFIRVLETANGQLSLLVVRELNSNAGGMGAGGGREVGTLFCAYAERRTSAKIRHQMIRLGGLTYASVAPRAIDNTGRMTALDLDKLVENHVPAGRLQNLELYELPLRSREGLALRDNRSLRDALAGTLLQARSSKGVEGLLDSREVNPHEVNDSPLEGILRVQASWSETLDQELLMRAAVAGYRDQLKALREKPDAPDMTVAMGVEVELKAPDSPVPTLAEVMEALRKSDGTQSSLLDRLQSAEPQHFRTTVLLKTVQAQAVALDEVLREPERPRDFGEVRSLCRRFRGVIAHLEQAHRAAEDTYVAAKGLVEKHCRAVMHAIRRLRSFRHHLDVFLLTRSRVLRRTQRTFETYREVHERYSQAKARTEALAAAVAKVRSDLARYEELWIARVERGLEEIAGKRSAYLDTVEFAPLEAMYSDLLDAVLRAGAEASGESDSRGRAAVRTVLIRSVMRVTLKGLAEMLKTDPDPGAIIAALEDGRFPYGSPLWGGESSYVEPRYRCVVLPRLADADKADLKRAAEERHFGPTLTTADTMAAGCGIVALSFFLVTKRDEVLSPPYAHAKGAPTRNEPPTLSLEQPGNGGAEIRATMA